ncbi:cleavage and polyadenylation specificity factor subunit 1 [Nematocida parisii]|nr:cleavage and polyadenylation specificity factor subunit 1 [Nematocida parisii]
MNHLLLERYVGSANQHVVMGEFIKGRECVISAGCDRIILYEVAGGVLVKIKEKRVFGCILGLAGIPSQGEEADSVLVHFEHARVSAVIFDVDQNEFVCRALRFYEKQQYGFFSGSEKHTSFIRVDEEHGVSFLQISNTHFAIFSSKEVGRSKVFEMQNIRPRHCAIKDAIFLRGYSSPTLCFLFEDTVADRSRILVYILNEESELSFFFEVESVPHGCYLLAATHEMAFMVLGACGALFYTQWEMLGVRFNEFWSFEVLGIEEKFLKEQNFMVENGMCIVKDRDVFLFSDGIFLRFTILGGNSRISSVVAEKIELPIGYNRPYSTAVYKNHACISTAEGLFLVTFTPDAVVEEKQVKPERSTATQEYADIFLGSTEMASQTPPHSDSDEKESDLLSTATHPRSTAVRDRKHTRCTRSTPEPEKDRKYESEFEREYENMFKMAGETEKKSEIIREATITNKIVILQTIPSLGEIFSIEPLPLMNKTYKYLISAGSFGQPLLIVCKDGVDILCSQTAKITGYSDLFVVDTASQLYLVTNHAESTIVKWDTDINQVDSELSNNKTILFKPLMSTTGYIQVTTHEIVYITKEFKKKKEFTLPERITQAVYASTEKVFVLTETGLIYQYTGGRKLKLSVTGACAISVHASVLYICTDGGSLLMYSIPDKSVYLECKIFSVFPSVVREEKESVDVNPKHRQKVLNILVMEQFSKIYLLVQTKNNEIILYTVRDRVLYKEPVTNNAFYYERSDPGHVQNFGRIRMCDNLVFIPGHYKTRILIFTEYTHCIHTTNIRIDSIEEITENSNSTRSFIVMAKGSIAKGNLPVYSYDKSVLYRKTKVDSICEKISYSKAKKVIVAATYKNNPYTEDMIPFTVQATTELDAELVPAPVIPKISVNPLTRAYSLKIYSHEEMKVCSRTEGVLMAVDEYRLENNEYIAYHKIVTLPDKQNTEGFSEFVIVCTTYITDEDLMARGRLIVLEIASVVPQRDRIETRHKLKALAAEKTKGATTCCDIVKGNIVVCVGTKLMIYMFDRNEGLRAVAFHDIHVFLTSCMVMRNIIVCGDAYKGTFLLFYQSDPPLLHMLSQSSGGVYLLKGIGMTLHDTALSLISYDSLKTVCIYTYSPQHILSQDGSRLISRGECKLPDDIAGSFLIEKKGVYRTALYTKHGYVYSHKTVVQTKYIALLDLQHAVESAHWMTLGTNPRSHWVTERSAEMKDITLKEILQTGLMEEFFNMCTVQSDRIVADTGRASADVVKTELCFYQIPT